MLQSSRCVQRLIRLVVLSLIVLPLSPSLTFARTFSIVRSQETKADASKPAPNPPDIRKLEVGKPIERELQGGESHTYEITLAAGQYLDMVVDQRGIDVVVRLLAPDGKQIIEVDSPNGAQGPEPITLVAEESGNHQLSVASFEKGSPIGRYEIHIVELRQATAKDRALQDALNLFVESVRMTANGQYDAALSLAERALAIREGVLGLEHLDIAMALFNMGTIYEVQGNYRKAELPYSRALAIRERLLGPEHLDVAQSLNNLGWVYYNLKDYAKAEPLYRRALAIREKVLGSEHPDLIQSLNNLAQLYSNEANYMKAEPLYRRALAIQEKTLGPNHLGVARALNNLVELYLYKGDYEKVEPLGQQALRILEKTSSVNPFDLNRSLTHLALFYQWRGEFTKAEPFYQRVLTVAEKAFGPETPQVIFPLNNFAGFYVKMKEYTKAETLYLRALKIVEKTLRPDSHELAATLNNLADMYRLKGDYSKAEPLSYRALDIWERTFGPEHHNVALPLSILADIHRVKRHYLMAETFYQRALAIREKAFGSVHPLVADSLIHLTRTHLAKGDTKKAIEFLIQANNIIERLLALNITTGSERQKLLYLAHELESTNASISIHVRYAPNNLAASRLALTIILRRKARALDAMIDSIGNLRGRFSEQDRVLLDQLTETRSQLATLIFTGSATINLTQRQTEIKRLEEKIEGLEAEISTRSTEFRAQSQPVTITAIQSVIPRNAVLVEFAAYRPFNPKFAKLDERFGEPRYVAYILRSQDKPTWVELGEARAIDDVIDAFRKALRDPERSDVKQLARKADELVMQPVRRLLGKTDHVFISPDGLLNLIPFAVLVDEKGRYLVKRYHFTYLTSGRDLLRLQEHLPSKQRMLVIANPDYGPMSEAKGSRSVKGGAVKTIDKMQTPAASDTFISDQAIDFSQVEFPPLPGTEQEARALRALMPEATVMMREQATKAAIEQANAPSLLHVATHGFFLENVVSGSSDARGISTGGQANTSAMRIENPLLRSGLAMAGANLHKRGDDNGILTALEVSGLNLWGTKLVVLSACETGVGEVQNFNGVVGLRRALVLAGSESQMMSLWKVDDTATRDLMIDYYTRLKAGQGRSEALRQVQLKMLASPRYQHPYFWAGFIESGEWANLAGKRRQPLADFNGRRQPRSHRASR